MPFRKFKHLRLNSVESVRSVLYVGRLLSYRLVHTHILTEHNLYYITQHTYVHTKSVVRLPYTCTNARTHTHTHTQIHTTSYTIHPSTIFIFIHIRLTLIVLVLKAIETEQQSHLFSKSRSSDIHYHQAPWMDYIVSISTYTLAIQ